MSYNMILTLWDNLGGNIGKSIKNCTISHRENSHRLESEELGIGSDTPRKHDVWDPHALFIL